MITWELADRLIFERGLKIPVEEGTEYEDKRLCEVAHELHRLHDEIALLEYEVAHKGLHPEKR